MEDTKTLSLEIAPIVPRQFITTPFFPAKRQDQPRVIEYKGVKWTLGADRFDGRARSQPFDMRHGRVCFALLTFRDRIQNGRELGFSINELAHRVARSNGGRYCRDLINILFDLRDIWIHRDFPDGSFDHFSILGEIKIFSRPARRKDALKALNSQQGELWLDYVTLNEHFFGLLKHYEELARFRFDVLTAMTSDVAQCIYTFLPSRAVHHDAKSPFQIRLTTLLEQVGLPVPKHKSLRRKIFTQNKMPILGQLDGAETMAGTLRVKLIETKDGSDYKMLAWVKPTGKPTVALPPKTSSSLLQAWLDTGRSKQQFDRRMRHQQPLSDYALYLLNAAELDYKDSERFLCMAAALLGENLFCMELAQMKADNLQHDGQRRATNPMGRLIWRLLEAIKTCP